MKPISARISSRMMCCVALTMAGVVNVPAAPADATTDASASKNCTGQGVITARVSRQPGFGYQLAVKKAGPPSGPSWGVDVAPSGAGFKFTVNEARVSPYSEGTWSVHSDDPALTASASCSRRAAPTATPAKTVSLGNKDCGSGQVVVGGDGYSDIWVSWKKTATGARHRAFFPGPGVSDQALQLNEAFTLDPKVFGIKVSAYRTGYPGSHEPDEWLAGTHLHCD